MTGGEMPTQTDVADYWTRHNVTLHHQFASPAESVAYLEWRNDQYFDYIKHMPLHGVDGLSVLDFGCGPGHDLVGFGLYSKPARLVGADLSSSSLGEARDRLALHGVACELRQLDPRASRLPFEDGTFDFLHSSGVIHHVEDTLTTMRELARILKKGGRGQIMIYNRDSVWYHLYVSYQIRLMEGRYADLSVDEAFARSTDGEDCPISRVHRPEEFVRIAEEAGLSCRFVGAGISAYEAMLFHELRFKANMDRRLAPESRRFLHELTLDERGLPMHRGALAGIDACFAIAKP
jgi:ubiquinone/menaquinone biosynthesis C-methylase UbiE